MISLNDFLVHDLMVSQNELALDCIQRMNENSITLLLTGIQQMRYSYG